MAYVTGSQILAQAGVGTGTAAEQAWAAICAAAVEAAIATRLGTVTASDELADELAMAALSDGVMAYVSRDAPHGVLSVGPDATPVRLGADILRACRPVLLRNLGPGFA
jgi:hypothetical protein